jgi:hypothetical protein
MLNRGRGDLHDEIVAAWTLAWICKSMMAVPGIINAVSFLEEMDNTVQGQLQNSIFDSDIFS